MGKRKIIKGKTYIEGVVFYHSQGEDAMYNVGINGVNDIYKMKDVVTGEPCVVIDLDDQKISYVGIPYAITLKKY